MSDISFSVPYTANGNAPNSYMVGNLTPNETLTTDIGICTDCSQLSSAAGQKFCYQQTGGPQCTTAACGWRPGKPLPTVKYCKNNPSTQCSNNNDCDPGDICVNQSACGPVTIQLAPLMRRAGWNTTNPNINTNNSNACGSPWTSVPAILFYVSVACLIVCMYLLARCHWI